MHLQPVIINVPENYLLGFLKEQKTVEQLGKDS
jgi:uncharacterized protein (DUF3820 family)